jgi:hypothetical protein
MDARYAFQIGKKSGRFQATVERPLVPDSSKTLVDSSTESRLHRLANGIVNTILNKESDYKYVVAALNILLSKEFTREQMRHFDLQGYYDEELKKKPGISLVIPIDYTGSIAVWAESHKYVQAAKKLEAQGIAEENMVSEFRKINGNVAELEKTIEYFGQDEMFMVLDNTVHAGAKNHANKAVCRMHIYAVIEGTQANTKDTNILQPLIWNITRKGAESEDFYSSLTNVADPDSYAEEGNKTPKKAAKAANAGKGKGKAVDKSKEIDKAVEDTPEAQETQEQASKKRKVGRPRKYDN